MFNNMRVLVAGGTGMVGIQLVKQLLKLGAKVRIASLDDASRAHPEAEFKKTDLRNEQNCFDACQDMNYVFNLLCVKGSPAVASKYPVHFLSMTRYNSFLIEAAYKCGAQGYLFTSTNGVYQPAEVLHEDDVWTSYPSSNDRFAGYAKRLGELEAEGYRIQYGWDVNIVRPANIYGPYDNFDSVNAMVVPSLIKRAVSGEDPFVVWGDGQSERDFIHAKDVARGMLCVAEKNPAVPVNIGSGIGTSIKTLVNIVLSNLDRKPRLIWDLEKPSGDLRRVLDTTRALDLGFSPTINLESGIADTMRWYRDNGNKPQGRYEIFDKV